jgi:hypothetical protein
VTWTYLDWLVMSCRAVRSSRLRRPAPGPSAVPADLVQGVVEAIARRIETTS